MNKKQYNEAIEILSSYLPLSEEALQIAEGWSMLSERSQRHVKLLIDDHISNEIPVLKRYYDGASKRDQLRANEIIERTQQRLRRDPGDVV